MKQLLLIILLLGFSSVSFSQEADSLRKQLDSLHKEDLKPDNKPINEVDKGAFTDETNITPKAYVVLLATDFKQEVTGPFHSSKKTWIKVGQFALIEGALLFADKAIQREAFSFMNRNPNLQNVSQYVTNFGDSYQGLVLLAFGAYGVIFKSNKVKTTALLATQSYIVSAAMSSLVKFCVGRVRPHSFSENPNNLVFEGPNRDGFGSSFPSGHATAAFSAATVFAQQYKDQTLIPVIAYSAATIIALSRISENAHWATDVFAGAALGYVTGKQVVNNYHRYARLKNGKAKTSLLFNLQYCEGVIMPGLVYKF